MKKLDLISELNESCPKCHHQLKMYYDVKRIKAKNLRLISWIILAFFTISALPPLTDALTGNFQADNWGQWLVCGIAVILGIIFVVLRKKIKDFELVPHHIAYCKHCHQEFFLSY